MEEKRNDCDEEFGKRKIKKHWKAFTVLIAGCVVAIVGAFLVLFWFIETSPIGDKGSATIGEWSIAWIWGFFILLMLWELLIIGIPGGIAFGLGWYFWWNRLSAEEKAEFKGRDKKSSHRGKGAGGCGFVMFIAYSIYLYINGDFYTPFKDHSYSYWLYSYFLALAWLLIIFGIPAAIILTIVYFKVWRKK